MTAILRSVLNAREVLKKLRKRVNRKLKPIKPSRKDELWYKSSLLEITKDLSRRVTDELVPLLKSLEPSYVKVQDQLVTDRTNHSGTAARIIIDRIEDMRNQTGVDRVAKLLAEAATRRVSKSVDKQIVSSVRQSVSVDISGFLTQTTAMQEVMVAASKANIRLIKSIPEKFFETLGERLTKGLEQGLRFEELAKSIKEVIGVTDSRAKLIARDQISKMNGAMTMLRQTSLGMTHYTWSTAADERVRESHADLDGEKIAWDSPPSDVGHPGQDINCRCVAIPIIDLDEDIGGNADMSQQAIDTYFGDWAQGE